MVSRAVVVLTHHSQGQELHLASEALERRLQSTFENHMIDKLHSLRNLDATG